MFDGVEDAGLLLEVVVVVEAAFEEEDVVALLTGSAFKSLPFLFAQ